MNRVALVVVLLAAASGARADECSELGLESTFLTQYYCGMLQETAKDPGATRGWTPPDGEELPEETGIELIDRAYRADPRKTLELIKRIKGAGGLAGTTTTAN